MRRYNFSDCNLIKGLQIFAISMCILIAIIAVISLVVYLVTDVNNVDLVLLATAANIFIKSVIYLAIFIFLAWVLQN